MMTAKEARAISKESSPNLKLIMGYIKAEAEKGNYTVELQRGFNFQQGRVLVELGYNVKFVSEPILSAIISWGDDD